MRELNNNVEIAKTQQLKNVLKSNVEEVIPAVELNEEKIASDFSNPSAEVLGRSQVAPADALQKDVTFGMANPEAIEQADKFFNIALSQLDSRGVENSYAKASELSSAYVKEFVK